MCKFCHSLEVSIVYRLRVSVIQALQNVKVYRHREPDDDNDLALATRKHVLYIHIWIAIQHLTYVALRHRTCIHLKILHHYVNVAILLFSIIVILA